MSAEHLRGMHHARRLRPECTIYTVLSNVKPVIRVWRGGYLGSPYINCGEQDKVGSSAFTFMGSEKLFPENLVLFCTMGIQKAAAIVHRCAVRVSIAAQRRARAEWC